MEPLRKGGALFALCAFTAAASAETVIYPATVVTMDAGTPQAQAVAVDDGTIAGVGTAEDLAARFPGATLDRRFADAVIVPGLIDPHIHMVLSSIQYALPTAPPWDMAAADGWVEGLGTREDFLARLRQLEAEAPRGEPVIVYGYHNLVHGDLTRADLDAIAAARPFIVWHYSSHDFYLNSAALDWAGIAASHHEQFEGIALDATGELTGRIYEDAIPLLLNALGPLLFAPDRLATGVANFSALLRRGGVTTVADLGYGIFGLPLEDANIRANWITPGHSGYRLYLVPEHRAFAAAFGDERVETVRSMASGERNVPAPVLSQVKFFTDAAFYSQTMRLSEPGYLSGQSEGSLGLWVLRPGDIADTIRPYWEAGLDVRIHSNGDAAQDSTLDALAELRDTRPDGRFIVEHAGLFSPAQIARAAQLDAGISAASHYVFFLGEAYQGPLGEERGAWISPLGSLSAAGVPVTLHSDAPLAPPMPLVAASVHMTRSTREGTVLTEGERMTPQEALEAITIDAAYALGLEREIGSVEPGKRADFTILDANPLETGGEQWRNIGVLGVILDGEVRLLDEGDRGQDPR